MYFKYEVKIEQLDFPLIGDFYEDNGFMKEGIDIKSEYSLFFSFNKYNIAVLLPIKNRILNKGIVLCDISCPTMENILYCELTYQNHSELIQDLTFEINNELRNRLMKIIDVLQWRFDLKGSHDYLLDENFYFSKCSEIWKRIVLTEDVTIYSLIEMVIYYKDIQEFQDLIQDMDQGPSRT